DEARREAAIPLDLHRQHAVAERERVGARRGVLRPLGPRVNVAEDVARAGADLERDGVGERPGLEGDGAGGGAGGAGEALVAEEREEAAALLEELRLGEPLAVRGEGERVGAAGEVEAEAGALRHVAARPSVEVVEAGVADGGDLAQRAGRYAEDDAGA